MNVNPLVFCVFCTGKKFSQPVCVREDGEREVEVDEKECLYLSRGEIKKKDCNTHCHLEWREVERTNCSADCGSGTMSIVHQCIRVTTNQKKVGT